VAGLLTARGFGESGLIALAHMGGAGECRFEGRADDWHQAVPDFHTLAVECIAGPNARWHPRIGLPDEAFEHDGKLTKREIRALALAKLMPHPGALLWDIGAGCGSVAVEWMRAETHARAIALEPNADRRQWPRVMPPRSACWALICATARHRERCPHCLPRTRCSSAAAYPKRRLPVRAMHSIPAGGLSHMP
jgi:hypothetical protein